MSCRSEAPVAEQRVYHVNVRLKGDHPNGDWRMAWRQVTAKSFDDSFRLAETMQDVMYVYESSLIPGGVAT